MLVYTVRRGDTLWQIAKEYQISLDALLAANPHISDPNYILPGSRINVPRLAAMPEPEEQPTDWRREGLLSEEQVARREELLREEETRRQEEMMRREETLREEEMMRREETLREEEMMRREETLREEEMMRREEMLREEEMMRREEMLREERPAVMERQTCATDGARPCIYVTVGGETLHSISEEWGVPLAQLHYHNYRFNQGSQLPGGERVIIPLAHDYRIQVNSVPPTRGLRGRRRR